MAGISNDKLRALDSAMRQIEKDFGKGSIIPSCVWAKPAPR